jgi:NADH:ubiquinone oxidoreductase subunit 3 (subunit A)
LPPRGRIAGDLRRCAITAIELFFVLLAIAAGGILIAYGIAIAARGVRRRHRGEQPAWPRFHVHFYVFAILFIAFDMEMAFMYPWAVVFRDLGVFAYAEIGFFLTVLGLGILYAWRERALEWS